MTSPSRRSAAATPTPPLHCLRRPSPARPDSFHLTLRGPDDLQVVAPPPWWTRPAILWLLAGVGALSLLATGVVMVLARLRLKQQLQQRRMAEAEFSARLSGATASPAKIHID